MDRLRIGIDGYNLAMPKGTGVATYGHVLATTLRDAGHRIEGVFGIDAGANPALRETLFFERLVRPQPTSGTLNRTIKRMRMAAIARQATVTLDAVEIALTGRVDTQSLDEWFPRFDRLACAPWLFWIAHRHFRRHRRFARLRMTDPPPIMHWTYPVPVVLEGSRNIYTLHDLVPLRLPFTTLDDKSFHRDLLAGCIAHAAQICTVSEASRDDIVAEFGLDPARVTNTYQATSRAADAVDPPQAADADALHGLFGLRPQGYFLFAGAAEPKKNIGRVLEAFLSLPTDTPLVLVTGRSWQSEDELRLLAADAGARPDHARRLSERVIRLDHLPRRQLVQLMRSARALLFPSLLEGFGLPVLEAMELGTPVLAGNRGSLPEVAGDAALLVDPYDVGAIADGLRALDGDADLRTRLSADGPRRARLFSRHAYRHRLEALYAGVLAAPG